MTKKTFRDEYSRILKRAISFNDLAGRKGIASLDSEIGDLAPEDDRDIFKWGILKVIDEAPPDYIEKLLANLIIQESDTDKRLLKLIQKEAVMCIQKGMSVKLLADMLNSYTDIPAAEHYEMVDSMMPEEEQYAEYPVYQCSPEFLEIQKLPGAEIQKLLGEVDEQELVKAIRHAGKEIQAVFFRNMSDRAEGMIREDMEYSGDLTEEEAAEAQQGILAVIRKFGVTPE